ncbi:MAG: FAD-dependent oxidoreductase, partial [Gammaproteobacteria bacterium]|nr:FAD-dependent oxidoreductase [Gammaproteobacteria bacterium]
MSDISIIVVGAGVVGASTALALQSDGHRVTLLDREKPCAGASFGNAGLICNASCVPMAMPGITTDVIRMIGQPLAPMSIRLAYLHRIFPWLIRFVYQSRSSRVQRNARNLHALTVRAVEGWRRLTGNTELAGLLKEGGWLKVYESERTFAMTDDARELMDEIGSPYEILAASDIRDLEPQLAPIFDHGIWLKNTLKVDNPQRMVQGMVDLFVGRGGVYEQFHVRVIRIDGDRVELDGGSGTKSADKVVVAAGAWSRPLAKQLGDAVPLDTERGYHLMFSVGSSVLLNRPVMNGDASFVLSPMETGLRMTSQVEFAGLDAPADYRRVRSLLPLAKRMLPGMDDVEKSVWMGCRPSLPDSLPVLGFASRSNNVLYAFGHQHLGMTMGPLS